jgi:hypothetical protein
VRRVRTAELDSLDSRDDVLLVVGCWSYTGRGHSLGESIFAASVAQDVAESRRISRLLPDDPTDGLLPGRRDAW